MFENIISLIKPLDETAMAKCQLRLDNLTKPLGSLHSFEHIARQMAGITGQHKPKMLKKGIILMAGDHGINDEGVSTYSKTVTAEMMINSCHGGAAINVFAEHVGAQLVLVDMGVEANLSVCPNLCHEKIAYGTKNITQGSAMTRDEGSAAISAGIRIAQEQINKGCQILGLGAIGIGNTLPSVGIIACYSSKKINELIGLGTGITPELLSKRIDILNTALAINQPDPQDALDVVSKIGGFEIAGLVGVILGAASGGVAVVLDGLATSAAALIAMKIAPQVKDYLVASHFAVEPAHKVALDLMEIPGYLHLDMHLGEGTGAALGMSLINASLHVINDMKTFGEAEVAVAQDGPGALKQDKNVRE
ncbi:nicotinate-nucleotide--dimethylbenzimidazole phosphoribosyltransferase [Pelosinus sp. sgz500959]|uniref:nicotinate-nucleotide--dimethylbenzimidazole phosphoribosyltransferase n=1 Tax=Pelosinus sp. sgz500959 TaxID=3242472 RepID=UPI00366AC09B